MSEDFPELTATWDYGRLNCKECPRGQFEDNVSYYRRLARFYTSQKGVPYRNECVARAYDAGKTIKELAEDFGLTEVAVRLILRKVPSSYKARPPVPEGRDKAILERVADGESYASIGRAYGITGCRVRDIWLNEQRRKRFEAFRAKLRESVNAQSQ